eukprot:7453649-Pyramimonas_sp.AAC.1
MSTIAHQASKYANHGNTHRCGTHMRRELCDATLLWAAHSCDGTERRAACRLRSPAPIVP